MDLADYYIMQVVLIVRRQNEFVTYNLNKAKR
nr:MAG TPA: hypothetical protein [Caudoviricetes sp.]